MKYHETNNYSFVSALYAARKVISCTQPINAFFRIRLSIANKPSCMQMFTNMNAKILPVIAKCLWKTFLLQKLPRFALMH